VPSNSRNSRNSRSHLDPSGTPFVGCNAPAQAKSITKFSSDRKLNQVLLELSAGFGPQYWWPAATPFEVCIGAVLTQNTAWGNVELALAALRARGALTPHALLALPHSEGDGLEAIIRPSGSFRMKARKLRALSVWYQELGPDPEVALATRPLAPLREQLLGVFGVGPETADSILCYAGGRLSPVVDAYARRVFSRHLLGPLPGTETAPGTFPAGDAMSAPYEELRTWLQEVLVPTQAVFEEFHALFVAAGKDNCKPKPACDSCPAASPDKLLA
jgi:endonuclease-3 related protein